MRALDRMVLSHAITEQAGVSRCLRLALQKCHERAAGEGRWSLVALCSRLAQPLSCLALFGASIGVEEVRPTTMRATQPNVDRAARRGPPAVLGLRGPDRALCGRTRFQPTAYGRG